jgi:predicted TIM-barrel fold metal-dependent hydrolase
MLAKESGAENYPDLMEKALDALKVSDADKDSIFVGNAFRFYDLKPAGKGRQRFLSI